jgi:hypothetical protein
MSVLLSEEAEFETSRGLLSDRFVDIVANDIMGRQKIFTFFTTGYSQIVVILPYIIAGPLFRRPCPTRRLEADGGVH